MSQADGLLCVMLGGDPTRRNMNADELDRILREFRKEHPPRQPKDRKGSRRPKDPRRDRTGMDRLVDCIEEQLDALEDVPGTIRPGASTQQ